ncbi:uncharacterized protein LOC34620192 [Cyclospora cayetanensis]|uniref:PAN domain-containing protein n=2 Tax=Cyclospora cayetanensis TaxID=88456 RepID=A0A1D3CRX6_9EIME|nr:uncharacterized protein LOC34620192 [Cyclospora cayetanensis]OEH73912.1 PAN domain-containing protein [Cyclospora cayetanensis]
MHLRVLAASVSAALLAPRAALGDTRVQAAECFEYDYDFHGHDIQQVPLVGSPAACMDECAAYRGCGFWTYDILTRICYLKSAGAFTERRAAKGYVSGPRQCTFSSNCFEAGIDYYGYDIEKIEGRYVMNPAECQRLCTGNPQCAFFSWKFSTHSCFLKSAPAVLNRREDPDVTSGPRTCHNMSVQPPRPSDYPAAFDPSTAPASCVESGVEYRGHTIKTSKAKSAPVCHRQCQQTRDCYYWTWSSQHRTCALKNSNAPNGRFEGETTLDKVSGTRDCVPVLPGCQFADVGVVGARLNTRSANSFDACQFFCAAFSGCTHFSYDLLTGDCNLWSSFNAYSKGNSTSGLVSGPAFCEAETVCFEQSDYVGHNVEENETGEVESPAACQALCRNNSDCHYWSWLRSNKGCYLKDANAILGRVNDTTSIGRFSGPKWCSVRYGCMHMNAVYTGVSLQHMEIEDYKACGAKCIANPFCSAWTFHSDLDLCSLFSGAVSLSSKPIRGVISGERTCVNDTEQESSCFEEGILYSLDKIIGIADATSAFQCYQSCQKVDNCEHWAFRNGESCFLLPAGTHSFVFDPNSVSGPRICSEASPPLSNKVALTGDVIASSTVYSPGRCLQKCLNTPKCLYWSFVLGEETNCNLFETATSVTGGKSAISGTVASAVSSSSCTFSDPIGTVTVEKPKECVVECQAHRDCKAWQAKVEESSKENEQPLVTCTLFKSDKNPASVRDGHNITCGTSLEPGKVQYNTRIDETRNVVLTEPATTLSDCASLCSSKQECVAWSHRIGNQCIGYSTAEQTLEDSSGYSTGYVERPTPVVLFNTSYAPAEAAAAEAPRLASSFRRRFTSRATSVSRQVATSVNDCIEACAESPTCTAWTFKDETCSYYSSAVVPTTEEDAISGRRSTPQLPWTFELGKKFTGPSLRRWSSPAARTKGDSVTETANAPTTAMECAEKAEEEGCWSFKPADGEGEEAVCETFTECDNSEEEEGWISGKSEEELFRAFPPSVSSWFKEQNAPVTAKHASDE